MGTEDPADFMCDLLGAAANESTFQAARPGSITAVQVPLARLKTAGNVTRKFLIDDNVTGRLGPSQGVEGGVHVNAQEHAVSLSAARTSGTKRGRSQGNRQQHPIRARRLDTPA